MNFRNKIYNEIKKHNKIKKYEGKIYLNCCIGVEHDLDLLEYSIDYYKGLGVDELFYILNTEDSSSFNLKEAIQILDKYPEIHKSIWIGEYSSGMVDHKEDDFIKDYVSDNDWVITVDADEFYEFPMGLRELITTCEEKGYHCVAGKFVDRIAIDGKLKKIDKTKSLWEQFPVNKNLCVGHYLVEDKVLLRKNYITLHPGHHFPTPRILKSLIYPEILNVHHFHWVEGLIEKLEDRIDVWERLGINKKKHIIFEKLFSHYDKYGTLL